MAFGPHPAKVDTDDYGRLMCKCGNDYLHQQDITLFVRGEDGETTTVIAQNGHTAQVSSFPSDDTCNPSPRRHGLILEFMCESCSWDYDPNKADEPVFTRPQRLAIYQHKGGTFLEWLD